MKVMVTTNIETDLDITNCARGTVADTILHPEDKYETHTEDETAAVPSRKTRLDANHTAKTSG